MPGPPRPITYHDCDGAPWPGWLCACGLVYITEGGAWHCPCRLA